MSQNTAIAMQDKEMLEDVLTSQKQITELYNVYANECATTAIRDEMMNSGKNPIWPLPWM